MCQLPVWDLVRVLFAFINVTNSIAWIGSLVFQATHSLLIYYICVVIWASLCSIPWYFTFLLSMVTCTNQYKQTQHYVLFLVVFSRYLRFTMLFDLPLVGPRPRDLLHSPRKIPWRSWRACAADFRRFSSCIPVEIGAFFFFPFRPLRWGRS